MTAQEGPRGAVEHFNELAPDEAERLAHLAEETGNLLRAIGQVLRHGHRNYTPPGRPNNRTALMYGCAGVLNAIMLLAESGDIDAEEMHHHAAIKRETCWAFMHHQPEPEAPTWKGMC
jgi:hypothetical protein